MASRRTAKVAKKPTANRAQKRLAERRGSYLEVVGSGERIPVPDDAAAERAAVAAHPVFKRSVARARADSAAGRAIPFDELRRQLDGEEEAGRDARRKPTGSRPSTANGRILLRLPLSIHQELLAQAERDRTSLNQLVLAYISRGLGQDAKSA